MSERPKKHSLTLRGHRTSVSLEDEFWVAFRKISNQKSVPINELAAQVDEQRGTSTGLATAIRLFVLEHCQSQIADLTEQLIQMPDTDK